MQRLGYVAVSLAALLWAVGGNFARTLMDRGASPVELTEGRAWITLAAVGALVWWRRRRRGGSVSLLRGLGSHRRELLLLFGLSLAAANVTYYLAISKLPVAVAIVVQYTAPGFIVLWKALVQKTRPTTRVTTALFFAFAGVVLVAEVQKSLSAGLGAINPLGVALALASAVAFATYLLSGEAVERGIGTERAVFYGFLVASIFWVLVQTVRGRPDTLLDPSFLPGIAFLAVATTIAPFLLFIWGLGRIKASAAGIASTLEPVSAALIAYLWLGQALTLLQIAGAGLVVIGIAVVQWERPERAVVPERAAVE